LLTFSSYSAREDTTKQNSKISQLEKRVKELQETKPTEAPITTAVTSPPNLQLEQELARLTNEKETLLIAQLANEQQIRTFEMMSELTANEMATKVKKNWSSIVFGLLLTLLRSRRSSP